MDEIKRKKLESRGWKIGDIDNFLGLNKEEKEYIELKITLESALHRKYENRGKTDSEDPSFLIDQLVRLLLSAGITKKSLAEAVSGS